MDNIKKIAILCISVFFAFPLLAVRDSSVMVFTGRFMAGYGQKAVFAQSIEPQKWKGDDYFLSELHIINVKNNKEGKICDKHFFSPNVLFLNDKQLLFSDGNRVYKCKAKPSAHLKLLYTVTDTQKVLILDLVKFQNSTYVVIEDYAEQIFDRYEMSEDENYYHCYLKIINLETGAEISRLPFPSMESPRYYCMEKNGRWVFNMMDATYVMDLEDHIQEAQVMLPFIKKTNLLYKNDYFTVYNSKENIKEVLLRKNQIE